MNINLINQVIVLCALSLFYTAAIAQQTIEFKIGENNNTATLIKPELEILNGDSLYFAIPYLGQVNNIDSMVSYHFNTNNFYPLNSATIFVNPINSNYSTWSYYEKDNANNRYNIEISTHDSMPNQIISMYAVNKHSLHSSHIFTDTLNDCVLIALTIVEDKLVIVNQSLVNGINGLELLVYSLSGNLQSRKHFVPAQGELYTQYGILIAGAHPKYPNSILLKDRHQHKATVLDAFTLDTIKTYGFDHNEYGVDIMNNYNVSTLHCTNTRVTNDALISTGTCTKLTSWQPATWDFQYFEFTQYWDGTYDIQTFGPSDVSNRGYAFAHNETQHTSIIAGSSPFDMPTFYAPEKRSVLIYVYDNYGKLDSLELFGNYNHVPFKIVTTDNGDIFMAGSYKDVWGTDDVYAWLTKIPGIATSLVEQKAITHQLHLYPNPCSNELRVDIEANFTANNFRIYNQTGQIIQTGTLSSNTINTAHLAKGSYILVVESEGMPPHNALFVKQ